MAKRPSGAPPVELAAAKSFYGHTETAAGVLGMLRAAGRLQQHQRSAVLHLRSLNAYVHSILDSGGGGFTAARQAAPGLLPPAGSMHTGCSAFAFQGTNAHAVLRSAPADSLPQPAQLSPAASPAWQRLRFWYQPAPHQLLTRVAISGRGGSSSSAAFEVALGRPALAFLWEHQVGEPAWPAACSCSI